jgi:uncharacterized glyoxalase superfamily protein PhnB
MPSTSVDKAIECIIPILRVESISASLKYYEGMLGFAKDWLYEKDSFAIGGVSRDGRSIYLCQGPQGNPGTWIWIGVEDVDVLYEEFKTSGAIIRMAPTNYSWSFEMRVEDPDGHVLRFGSESKAGVPCCD